MTDLPNETNDMLGAFEPSYVDYTAEELLEQAQNNAQASLVATVAFLQERSIPLEEWAAFLGSRFAVAWEDEDPWSADEFLDAMMANYRSLGATVVSADLGPARAEAVTTGFPDPAACAAFGASVESVARFHDATGPIAAGRGLRWSWTLEDPADARTRFVVLGDDGATER
jgi:hypothetical protein